MCELDHREDWVPKNWCFQTVVLEKTLESPLDIKEIKPVNPKGNQPWIFIGRTNADASVLWPPDAESWLIHKDPEAGKDCWQEEEGVTENELVGWNHWLNGLGLSKLQEIVKDRKTGTLHSMGSQRVRQFLATEHQQQYYISIPDSFSNF